MTSSIIKYQSPIRAVRVWKRDGSKLYQSIDQAADTLKSFALDPHIRSKNLRQIKNKLIAGDVIETKMSYIHLFNNGLDDCKVKRKSK